MPTNCEFAMDTSPTLVPLAETMMSLEAGLALELPEQSPCGYEHELSTPGAWATGDVLLTSATLDRMAVTASAPRAHTTAACAGPAMGEGLLGGR
jgi:hypothetical protein